MSEVTNNNRASRANTALSAFAVECYAPGAEDDETIMGDLLCNIRHLGDAHGWDIEKMWTGSRRTYFEEVAEAFPADASFGSGDDDEEDVPDENEQRIQDCQRDGWTFDYRADNDPPGWWAYKGAKVSPSMQTGSVPSIHDAAREARIADLEQDRDGFVMGHPSGFEEPDPEGWARERPEMDAELDALYAERPAVVETVPDYEAAGKADGWIWDEGGPHFYRPRGLEPADYAHVRSGDWKELCDLEGCPLDGHMVPAKVQS